MSTDIWPGKFPLDETLISSLDRMTPGRRLLQRATMICRKAPPARAPDLLVSLAPSNPRAMKLLGEFVERTNLPPRISDHIKGWAKDDRLSITVEFLILNLEIS